MTVGIRDRVENAPTVSFDAEEVELNQMMN